MKAPRVELADPRTVRNNLGRSPARSDRYRLVRAENVEPPKRKVLGIDVPASSTVRQLSD